MTGALARRQPAGAVSRTPSAAEHGRAAARAPPARSPDRPARNAATASTTTPRRRDGGAPRDVADTRGRRGDAARDDTRLGRARRWRGSAARAETRVSGGAAVAGSAARADTRVSGAAAAVRSSGVSAVSGAWPDDSDSRRQARLVSGGATRSPTPRLGRRRGRASVGGGVSGRRGRDGRRRGAASRGHAGGAARVVPRAVVGARASLGAGGSGPPGAPAVARRRPPAPPPRPRPSRSRSRSARAGSFAIARRDHGVDRVGQVRAQLGDRGTGSATCAYSSAASDARTNGTCARQALVEHRRERVQVAARGRPGGRRSARARRSRTCRRTGPCGSRRSRPPPW